MFEEPKDTFIKMSDSQLDTFAKANWQTWAKYKQWLT